MADPPATSLVGVRDGLWIDVVLPGWHRAEAKAFPPTSEPAGERIVAIRSPADVDWWAVELEVIDGPKEPGHRCLRAWWTELAGWPDPQCGVYAGHPVDEVPHVPMRNARSTWWTVVGVKIQRRHPELAGQVDD